MTSQPHSSLADEPLADPFAEARLDFQYILDALHRPDAPVDHADTERYLHLRGMELLRKLYQGSLDLGAQREPRRPTPAGTVARRRRRQVESIFGRVVVPRLVYFPASCQSLRLASPPASETSASSDTPGQSAKRCLCPRDRELNVPTELYSLPVRERVASLAVSLSFGATTDRLDELGGAHVPKRQAEQLVVRAAQDVDAFLARPLAANDTLSPTARLIGTVDSKGITMRPEALREATQKAAKAEASTRTKGDPMAPKKLRLHDKRMAVVSAVYETEPFERTPDQVLARMRREPHATKLTPPAVEHKRVRATVEKSQKTAIKELFNELARRDPSRERVAAILVDGEEKQQETIEKEARERGRRIFVILDLIHVLHYLWLAAKALTTSHALAGLWVMKYAEKLLTGKEAVDVAAGITQAATLRGLTDKEREPVEKCTQYLRKNARYLRYREALSQGYPIATGVIEGACRYVVQASLRTHRRLALPFPDDRKRSPPRCFLFVPLVERHSLPRHPLGHLPCLREGSDLAELLEPLPPPQHHAPAGLAVGSHVPSAQSPQRLHHAHHGPPHRGLLPEEPARLAQLVERRPLEHLRHGGWFRLPRQAHPLRHLRRHRSLQRHQAFERVHVVHRLVLQVQPILEHIVPDLARPPVAVPAHHIQRLLVAIHRTGGEQEALEPLLFPPTPDLAQVQRDHGQWLALVSGSRGGRRQGDLGPAQLNLDQAWTSTSLTAAVQRHAHLSREGLRAQKGLECALAVLELTVLGRARDEFSALVDGEPQGGPVVALAVIEGDDPTGKAAAAKPVVNLRAQQRPLKAFSLFGRALLVVMQVQLPAPSPDDGSQPGLGKRSARHEAKSIMDDIAVVVSVAQRSHIGRFEAAASAHQHGVFGDQHDRSLEPVGRHRASTGREQSLRR